MKLNVKIIFLFLVAVQSACSSRIYDKSSATSKEMAPSVVPNVDYRAIRSLLENQATAGPNCVSAALMGRGILRVPFNVLPSDMSKHAFAQCFSIVDTIKEGDIVALHADDVIFHVILRIGLDPGVFSKASASETSPFELISMEAAGNCLDSDGKIKTHCTSYRLNVTAECPLTAFDAFIRNAPPESVASRSGLFLQKIFGLTESTSSEIHKQEIIDEIELLESNPLFVDIEGKPTKEEAGINISFLYGEMLNNARTWVNRD
jgi:hypothetical protein